MLWVAGGVALGRALRTQSFPSPSLPCAALLCTAMGRAHHERLASVKQRHRVRHQRDGGPGRHAEASGTDHEQRKEANKFGFECVFGLLGPLIWEGWGGRGEGVEQ